MIDSINKNMKTIKYAFLILTSLLLWTSNSQSQESEKLKAFKKQEHRFELRECEFYYNDQQIELYKPKSDIENVFGVSHSDGGDLSFYKNKPFYFLNEMITIQQKENLYASSLSIKFGNIDINAMLIHGYQDIPSMAKGEYILIDGVPFGHDVSVNQLNNELKKKNKLTFSVNTANLPDTKSSKRAYKDCINSPQFFILYNEADNLKEVSYEMHKPKNLD